MAEISGEISFHIDILTDVSGEHRLKTSLELSGQMRFVQSLMPTISGEVRLRSTIHGTVVSGEQTYRMDLYERDEITGSVTLRLRMLDTSMGTTYPLYHFDKTHGL